MLQGCNGSATDIIARADRPPELTMSDNKRSENASSAIQVVNAQVVDAAAIADLLGKAETGDRKRSHLLLHGGHHDQVQRMVIMLEPGTYLRPHHHSEQWEMLALLRGGCDLLQFTPQGELTGRIAMSAASPVVQIPIGAWHGLYVHHKGTMLLEVKPGPYRPNEFADWAPPEGDPAVPQYLASLAR
jgi:cupin fold WbuC family metalloprotein